MTDLVDGIIVSLPNTNEGSALLCKEVHPFKKSECCLLQQLVCWNSKIQSL